MTETDRDAVILFHQHQRNVCRSSYVRHSSFGSDLVFASSRHRSDAWFWENLEIAKQLNEAAMEGAIYRCRFRLGTLLTTNPGNLEQSIVAAPLS